MIPKRYEFVKSFPLNQSEIDKNALRDLIMTLETIVFEIISRVVKIPAAKLNKDSGLGLVEGWDSLKHTELILQLENKFMFFDLRSIKLLRLKALCHHFD